MTNPQPPLLNEVEKYLKWEWENGLTCVDLPPFVPLQLEPTNPETVVSGAADDEAPAVMAVNVPQPKEEIPNKESHKGSVLPRLNLPSVGISNREAPLLGVAPDQAVAKGMANLRREWVNCTKCALCEKRHSFVFGEGNFHPRLLFIGEGPGEQEDRQGRPFVGPAGQLLTNLLKAMGLRREEVYITNIVKCRPPQNRDPLPEEVAACSPLLQQQIRLLSPELIVALGKPATHKLLNCTDPISRLRGHWFDYQGIPLLPTFHPSYLLRNPKDKALVWADMCQVLEKMGLPIPVLGRKTRS